MPAVRGGAAAFFAAFLVFLAGTFRGGVFLPVFLPAFFLVPAFLPAFLAGAFFLAPAFFAGFGPSGPFGVFIPGVVSTPVASTCKPLNPAIFKRANT